MSTQRNRYKMIGAYFDYNEYHELMKDQIAHQDNDDFEYKLDCHEKPFKDSAFEGISCYDTLTIIADGRDGEYVYIGQVQEKSKNWSDEYDYQGGFNYAPEIVEDLILKYFGIDTVSEQHEFIHYR